MNNNDLGILFFLSLVLFLLFKSSESFQNTPNEVKTIKKHKFPSVCSTRLYNNQTELERAHDALKSLNEVKISIENNIKKEPHNLINYFKRYLDILNYIMKNYFSENINLTSCFNYNTVYGYIIMFIGHNEFLRENSVLLEKYNEQIEQINNLLNILVPQLIKQYEMIGEKCDNGELLDGLNIHLDRNFQDNCRTTNSYYKNESGEIVLSCRPNGPFLPKPMSTKEICGKTISYPHGSKSLKII